MLFGATGGIGSALAHRLVAATAIPTAANRQPSGASKLILSAHDSGHLDQLKRWLDSVGGSVETAAADALDPDAVSCWRCGWWDG